MELSELKPGMVLKIISTRYVIDKILNKGNTIQVYQVNHRNLSVKYYSERLQVEDVEIATFEGMLTPEEIQFYKSNDPIVYIEKGIYKVVENIEGQKGGLLLFKDEYILLESASYRSPNPGITIHYLRFGRDGSYDLPVADEKKPFKKFWTSFEKIISL